MIITTRISKINLMNQTQFINNITQYYKEKLGLEVEGPTIFINSIPKTFDPHYYNYLFQALKIDLQYLETKLYLMDLAMNHYFSHNNFVDRPITLNIVSSREIKYSISGIYEYNFDKKDIFEDNSTYITNYYYNTLYTHESYNKFNYELNGKANAIYADLIPSCSGSYNGYEFNLNINNNAELIVTSPIIVNRINSYNYNLNDYSSCFEETYSKAPDYLDLNNLPDYTSLNDDKKARQIFDDTNLQNYKYKSTLGYYNLKFYHEVYSPTRIDRLDIISNNFKDNKPLAEIKLNVNAEIPETTAIMFYLQFSNSKKMHIIRPYNFDYNYYIFDKLTNDIDLNLTDIFDMLHVHEYTIYRNGIKVSNGTHNGATVIISGLANDIIYFKYTTYDNNQILLKDLVEDDPYIRNGFTDSLTANSDVVTLKHYPSFYENNGYILSSIQILNQDNYIYYNITKYNKFYRNIVPFNEYLAFTQNGKNLYLYNYSYGETASIIYKYHFDSFEIGYVMTNGKTFNGELTPVIYDYNIDLIYYLWGIDL